MTRDQAKGSVARGAALLDEKRPGWQGRIDTGVLSIAGCTCILFQLGGYSEVACEIGAYDDDNDASHFGFFVPWGEDSDMDNPSWQFLQDAWIEAIADRLVPTAGEGTAPAAKILSAAPAQVERHRVKETIS